MVNRFSRQPALHAVTPPSPLALRSGKIMEAPQRVSRSGSALTCHGNTSPSRVANGGDDVRESGDELLADPPRNRSFAISTRSPEVVEPSNYDRGASGSGSAINGMCLPSKTGVPVIVRDAKTTPGRRRMSPARGSRATSSNGSVIMQQSVTDAYAATGGLQSDERRSNSRGGSLSALTRHRSSKRGKSSHSGGASEIAAAVTAATSRTQAELIRHEPFGKIRMLPSPSRSFSDAERDLLRDRRCSSGGRRRGGRSIGASGRSGSNSGDLIVRQGRHYSVSSVGSRSLAADSLVVRLGELMKREREWSR